MSTGTESPQPPSEPPREAPHETPGPSGEQPPGQPGYQQPGQPPAYQQPGQQPGYPPVGYAQKPPLRPDEEKLWAIGAHLGPFLLGFIAPLVVWLVYRDRSAFLDRTAKEALNFQLTLLIGYLASFVLMFLLVGFLTFFVVWIGGIVLMILATIKVANFEDYRYPLTIRFIK